MAPHLARARGKILSSLAQIKAAKSPLAVARKLPSIVRCKRDDVHDIKINIYLHYQVVIIKAELRNAMNTCNKVVDFGASKLIILVDISCFNFMGSSWIGMISCINDVDGIVNEVGTGWTEVGGR